AAETTLSHAVFRYSTTVSQFLYSNTPSAINPAIAATISATLADMTPATAPKIVPNTLTPAVIADQTGPNAAKKPINVPIDVIIPAIVAVSFGFSDIHSATLD